MKYLKNMSVKKILVIDDDQDFNAFVEISFAYNWKILTAANGELGISLAKSQHPDLILLDVAMPRLNGLAVYNLLKLEPTTLSIPIIFFTSMIGMERIIKSKTNQDVPILRKHFNVTKLKNQINDALENNLTSIK